MNHGDGADILPERKAFVPKSRKHLPEVVMPAAIANILLEQGIPTDIPVAEWADDDGNPIVIQGWTGALRIAASYKEAAYFDIAATIDVDNVAHFAITADQIDTLVTGYGGRPVTGSPPTIKCGSYSVTLISAGDIPYSVVRGDVYINLALREPV